METASFGNGWEGRVVEGRFPLLERLDGSANCVSFLTVLQGLQEAVIRLISTNDAEADAYIAQWEFAKTLSHPHLAKILAAGRCVIGQSDLVYVVTERSNSTLAKTIQTATLKADSARDTFEPILSALSYLHKNGIVHGHVNPSNIQFAEMKPKLSVTDLLIAGTAKRSISQRSKYDAPELTQGMVTAACDTWSVGMIMCEAMTQALPSWDSSRDGEPEVTKSLPGPFREIVQDCLRVDPQRRSTIENIQWRMQEPVQERVQEPAQEPAQEPTQEPAQERKQERLEESKTLPLFDEPVPAEVASSPKAASQFRTEELRSPESPEGLPPPPPPPPPPVEKIETEAPSEPVIFSKPLTHFGEPGGGPLRIVGYGFVLLAVLALASFLLVRAGKIKIPAGVSSQKTPAASTPDAEKQSAVPTPAPTESTPDRAETQAGSPVSQAQPESTPPPTEALKAPETSSPVPQTKPKEAPRTEVQKAPTPEPPAPAKPSSAIRVEHRENSEGLVAKRVIPNVSAGALAGMRRPVEVVIRVSVNREGTVSDASYVSPGPGNYFARQAQRAAQSWTFTPPTRNGNAERSVWVLRFNFEREKTEATASLESK
jgi:eukaryotic-like serine/threonine-protein kinase